MNKSMKRQESPRNQRVRENLQLVTPIARHYAQRCGLDPDDLRQVGVMGLLKAADTFSTERCTPFKAFARPHIRGAILHYLRDKATVVRYPRQLQENRELKRQGSHGHGELIRRVYCNEETIADAILEKDQATEQVERSELIQNTLQTLSEPERSAIQTVVLEGRSLRGAAKLEGVSAMTVQRRVKRGLMQLRSKLENQLWAD